MLMSPMRDGRTTSKDRATQLLICELLSFAIKCSTKSFKKNFQTSFAKIKSSTKIFSLKHAFVSNKMLQLKTNLLLSSSPGKNSPCWHSQMKRSTNFYIRSQNKINTLELTSERNTL